MEITEIRKSRMPRKPVSYPSTFLPRINRALDFFVESWNNHPLSTEHNRTPTNQLFIEGALRQHMTPDFPHTGQGAPAIPTPSPGEVVRVPKSSFEPCSSLIQQLQQHDMLAVTDDFGYSIYCHMHRVVTRHLLSCNDCAV